jgi:hypothetical protein
MVIAGILQEDSGRVYFDSRLQEINAIALPDLQKLLYRFNGSVSDLYYFLPNLNPPLCHKNLIEVDAHIVQHAKTLDLQL